MYPDAQLPVFRKIWSFLNGGTADWQDVLTEHVPGEVYSFPFFTDEFCKTLLEEIFNFYDTGLPARRPNSMNNYGLSDVEHEAVLHETMREHDITVHNLLCIFLHLLVA